MVRAPCCEKMGLKKGPWTPEEDKILIAYIQNFGHGNWRALPKQAGLLRCGKSCRLRWTNYLRPDIKRGNFTKEEEETIIQLHETLGNKWSAIATRLPGRTDNEIKNVWHTHLKKRLKQNASPANQANKSTQIADDTKQVGEVTSRTPRYMKPGVAAIPKCENSIKSPESPQQSTSHSSSSSAESSSIITCDHRASVGSAAEDESMDSLESNWMQTGDSLVFWPEVLDDLWPETFKEDDFLADDVAVNTADRAPFSPLPLSMYQDDGMDFWLNVLMEAGPMNLPPEL